MAEIVAMWLRRRGWVCVPPERVDMLEPLVGEALDTVHGPWPPPGAYC